MTLLRRITSLLALTVVLANQVSWVSISFPETSSANCACSRSGACHCSHSGAAQQCHAKKRTGLGEGCFVAPHPVKTTTTVVVIQYDPHLLSARTGLALQFAAGEMDSAVSNNYDDVVRPCFEPPPESQLSS